MAFCCDKTQRFQEIISSGEEWNPSLFVPAGKSGGQSYCLGGGSGGWCWAVVQPRCGDGDAPHGAGPGNWGDLRPWGCWSEHGLAAWAPLVSTMQHQRLLCEGPGQKSCPGFESHFPEKLHWADVFLWKKIKISQMNKCFLMEKVVGKILMRNTLQHYWVPSSRAPVSSQLVSTVSIQWSPWNSVWYVWRDKGCFTHF